MSAEVPNNVVKLEAVPDGTVPDNGVPVDAQPAASSRTPDRSEPKPLPDEALIILPVRNLVLFPGVIMPLTVGRAKSRGAAQEAARLQRPIGVLLQVKPEIDDPRPEDMHWVGTTANIL